MNEAKERLRPVIRVFVSSTFSDMRHERNALQKDVFPKLEELCQKNGFQFQAIDLRWGVSSEAGLDHRAMRICFEELRRAQEISPRPNFLILLGNRYGWRPLPEDISVREFGELEGIALAESAEHAEILRSWYRRDDNAVPPVYILQSRRQDLADGKHYTEDEHWNKIQVVLWEIINRVMPPERMRGRFDGARKPNDPPPQIIRFQASATEQEIWQGALRVPDAKEHVLVFFREIAEIGAVKDPTRIKDFVDVSPSGGIDTGLHAEQERLKRHLRDRLGAANVFEARSVRLTTDVTADHLGKLCADVENRLTQIIQSQIDTYWQQTKPGAAERGKRELEIEQQEHARIAQERGGAKTFVGRADKLKDIRDYLLNDSTSPLVVHGASGCGKTALLARAAQEAGFGVQGSGITKNEEPGTKNGAVLCARFLGTTPRSSDLRGLLTSLCQELRLRHPREGELPTDIKLLEVELHEQLKAATAEQPLILFLDALDQLADTDGGRNLHWISTGPLPAHVKLVVSCLSDRDEKDPAGQPYAELQRRQLPATHFINLDAFSEDEARTLLFKRWLPQAGRTVSQDQRTHIEQWLKSDQCRQPIYLKLLFEEARLWRSYDATPVLGEDVPSLLEQLFNRLSRPTNHGQLLVERVLGYLAASREGLAENEILEILLRDPEYRKTLDDATETNRHEMPPNATRIPIAIWSRLRFDLASYLTERAATGANVLTLYHRQVAEWVQENFATASKAASPEPKHSAATLTPRPSPSGRGEQTNQSWQPHALLADYFRDLADSEKNQSWKGDSPRPFLQVVFHLVGAERSDEYCQILCDLRFVEARCRFGQVFELIADYRVAQENLPETKVNLREERERQERTARWTREIIDYSQQWNNRRVRQALGEEMMEPEPMLPEPIPTCEMWSEEKIEAECDRIIQTPTRSDRLAAFADFVRGQCYPLLEHGTCPGFAVQHAFNTAPKGAVHDAAEPLLRALDEPYLLRSWPTEVRFNPKSAQLQTLTGHSGAVMSVSITPDGRLAVSGGGFWDYVVRVWDLATGQCLRMLTGHSDDVNSVTITPDGMLVVSGSKDGFIRVWDVITGQCQRTLAAAAAVSSVSVTPNGLRIVAGNRDGTVQLWDLTGAQCQLTLTGHEYAVDSVTLTPDGLLAVSAGSDGVLVWNLGSDQSQRMYRLFDGCVRGISISVDGHHVVAGCHDKTVQVWDLRTRRLLSTLSGHSAYGKLSVMVTPDGCRAVSGSSDGTLRVWDLDRGTCLRTLAGHSSPINSVGVTADGRMAISGSGQWVSADNTVRVWDLASGLCMKPLTGSGTLLERENWTPTGNTKAITGYTKDTAGVLHLAKGPDGHRGPVYAICVTPDGKTGVSGGWDDQIRLWDLPSGCCTRKLTANAGVTNVCVTSDGRWLVSGGFGKTIQVWDLASFKCLRTLTGHGGWITSLSLMPDSRRAVSGSRDRTVRVWDLLSGRCLSVYAGTTPIRSVTTLGGGNTICAETATDELLSLACHNLQSGQGSLCSEGDHRDALRSSLDFSYCENGVTNEESMAHLDAPTVRQDEINNIGKVSVCVEEKDRAPLEEMRAFAENVYRRCLWDAAGSVYDKLLVAGEPIQECGPKLVRCLLNARESPLPAELARATDIITRLEVAGFADIAVSLHQQLAAKLPQSEKTPFWRRWLGGERSGA